MEKIIRLEPLYYRRQENIALYCQDDAALVASIKRLPGAKWCHIKKCWYVPLTKESYETICKKLKFEATIDTTGLKNYLEKKKQVVSTNGAGSSTGPVWQLSAENLAALKRFVEQLKLKAYSSSTIRTYRNEFLQLLKLLKHRPVSSLQVDDIRRYMVYAMEKEGISENTAHSRLNALKFYFEQVLGRERFFYEIPRPKKANRLPGVFNQAEVAQIINSLSNKKHKAMIMLAYGAGLRVSEIVALKTYQVDSKRMTLFLQAAKGKKDRIVGLSPVLLVGLREYAKEFNPDKGATYLRGVQKDNHIVFAACKRCCSLPRDMQGL